MTGKIVISSLLVVLLFVCGYVFIEIIPSRAWATAQPFRIAYVIRWLGWLVLAGSIVIAMQEKTRNRFLIPIVFAALLTTALIASTMQEQRGAFLFALLAMGYNALGSATLRNAIAIGLLVIIGASPQLTAIQSSEIRQRVPLLSRLMGQTPSIDMGFDTAIDPIAYRAKAHAPPGATFLTPPNWGRFRLVTERAIVVDFKAFPFTDDAMVEWKQRLDACYGPTEATGFAALREMESKLPNPYG